MAMVYLDNAATSFPKPDTVIKAVTNCLTNYCANPGRSGHSLSIEAARKVFETRETVAELFHAKDSRYVIFTANATMAINLVFHALLQKGDHVVVSSMEHNAVMRPLRHWESQGIITLSLANADGNGFVDDDIGAFIQPATRLCVINHASNVNGVVQDIASIAGRIKEINPDVAVLIDASQSTGLIPIDIQAIKCDFVAFTGHKALYGPQGIGGLVINTAKHLQPFIMGGTGSKSESQFQPQFLPDKFESGTLNLPGIAGLKAGIDYVKSRMDEIHHNELLHIKTIVEGLSSIKDLKLFWSRSLHNQIGVISVAHNHIPCSEIGQRLNDEFSVFVRTGLHCAPLAHETLGTYPNGTLRVSVGLFTNKSDVDVFCKAIEIISK